MARRESFDFYPTPAWATEILLRHLPLELGEDVLEPCAGDGDIADALEAAGHAVRRNDIRAGYGMEGDATDPSHWSKMGAPAWTITNPPFSLGDRIAGLALERSTEGVALLLRLTFLEPCKGRVALLSRAPPSQLIVMPRISFTGDGRCDNVTTAWMIWHRRGVQSPIIIEPRPSAEPGGLL